jgi:hypothetical protein
VDENLQAASFVNRRVQEGKQTLGDKKKLR